jgi:hypothetical protein
MTEVQGRVRMTLHGPRRERRVARGRYGSAPAAARSRPVRQSPSAGSGLGRRRGRFCQSTGQGIRSAATRPLA